MIASVIEEGQHELEYENNSLLLQCPFCGDEPILEKISDEWNNDEPVQWTITCGNELCKVDIYIVNTSRTEAIDFWNYRFVAEEEANLLKKEKELLVSLLSSMRWMSLDKDNMEFSTTITYNQLDDIRKVLGK